MAWGLNPVIANQFLSSLLTAAAFTPPAATYAALAIGDPGLNGTANPSSVTTRQVVTWNAAAGGSIAEAVTPTWGTWGGTSPESVQGLTIWSAVTVGTFLLSVQLLSPVVVVTGAPLNLPSLTVTFGPLAA
jgi:hypothetical protein